MRLPETDIRDFYAKILLDENTRSSDRAVRLFEFQIWALLGENYLGAANKFAILSIARHLVTIKDLKPAILGNFILRNLDPTIDPITWRGGGDVRLREDLRKSFDEHESIHDILDFSLRFMDHAEELKKLLKTKSKPSITMALTMVCICSSYWFSLADEDPAQGISKSRNTLKTHWNKHKERAPFIYVFKQIRRPLDFTGEGLLQRGKDLAEINKLFARARWVAYRLNQAGYNFELGRKVDIPINQKQLVNQQPFSEDVIEALKNYDPAEAGNAKRKRPKAKTATQV